MPTLQPLLPFLFPYLLVAFRLAGLLMFAPMLSSLQIPMRFKGLMVLMLAAALVGAVPTSSVRVETDLFGLLPLVFSETLIGFVVGTVAGMPLMAMQAAGVLTSHQVGFSLGQAYNPALESESEALGQLLSFVGVAAFLGMGGLEAAFLAVMNTFKLIPVGSFSVSHIPAELLIGTLASGIELSVRLSGPVVAMITLLLVVFGFLSRTMPALNVMTVGFTVKIMAALMVLVVSMHSSGIAIGEETATVMRQILFWSRGGK